MTKPQGDIGNLLKNLPNSATAHPRGKQITVVNVYGIFFSQPMAVKNVKLQLNH